MSNIPPQSHSSTVEAIYAQLNQRDIEQFSAGYQRWNLQQQIAALQTQLDAMRQQIVENTERMQAVHPTAIALATLARLQANGVSDLELLDRMLEQGEMWLDRTMQRLNYCEQLDDFIRDDYTQWCRHALEGAYDWIDSIQDGSLSSSPHVSVDVEETLAEATEELFLQKLSSDEEEKEEHDEHGATALEMETTLKRQAITIAHAEDSASPVEEIPSEVEVTSIAEETIPVLEEAFAGDVTDTAGEVALPHPEGAINRAPTEVASLRSPGLGGTSPAIPASDNAEPVIQEYVILEESFSAEDTTVSDTDQPAIHEYILPGDDIAASDVDEPGIQEYAILEKPLSVESSSISDGEQPNMQALDEVAPITEDSASTFYESPSQTMVTQPPRRYNFLVRLLAKLFGR